MTKRDYLKFAYMMAELRKDYSIYDKDGDAVIKAKDVESRLADIFKADNDRFDRDRFFAACKQ